MSALRWQPTLYTKFLSYLTCNFLRPSVKNTQDPPCPWQLHWSVTYYDNKKINYITSNSCTFMSPTIKRDTYTYKLINFEDKSHEFFLLSEQTTGNIYLTLWKCLFFHGSTRIFWFIAIIKEEIYNKKVSEARLPPNFLIYWINFIK